MMETTMPAVRRMLVPIDFSETARDAVRYADVLAQRIDARVTLLHVVPPLTFDYAMVEPTEARAHEVRTQRLNAARQALTAFPGPPPLQRVPARLVLEGDAAEQIVREACGDTPAEASAATAEAASAPGPYDLIVMPTRGRSALQRWLTVGSVTQRILHDAECPVLVGVDFAHAGAPFHIDHILCAVDLGSQTRRVLSWGAGLARELGARLSIVHATPDHGDAAADFFDANWRQALHGRLQQEVQAAAAEAQATGDLIIEAGEPHTVVARAAKRLNARLVIIGRGVSDDFLGRLRAHAYEIIRQSPCPVVSL